MMFFQFNNIILNSFIFILLIYVFGFFILNLIKFSEKKVKIIVLICILLQLFILAGLYVDNILAFFKLDSNINQFNQVRITQVYNFEWLSIFNSIKLQFGFQLDRLSQFCCIIVVVVSSLVQFYSLYYMKGENRFQHFFGYINFFSFSMMLLILSSNLLQLFICWEWMGLASFLLINYYYNKESANIAANKAFLITKFTDVFLFFGILILGIYLSSFDVQDIVGFNNITSGQTLTNHKIFTDSFAGYSLFTIALIFILMGCFGKSSMFPFHAWLPTAMEGPTPASALIHSATMVVAGIILLAKLYPLIILSQEALYLLRAIGLISAFLGAIMACFQNDLKKVLAYSTISQIGLMYLSLGMNSNDDIGNLSYSASLFHLFTQAFTKSALFLSAGIIIHFAHTNSIKAMGGYYKNLPYFHILFVILLMSAVGLPFFSGYFSKEVIFEVAHNFSFTLNYALLVFSFISCFYMFRLYFFVFYNKPSKIDALKISFGFEPTIVLTILAFLCLFVGFIPFKNLIFLNYKIWHFEPIQLNEFALHIVVLMVSMIIAARFFRRSKTEIIKNKSESLLRWFYFDNIFGVIIKKIIYPFSLFIFWLDLLFFNRLPLLIKETYRKSFSLVKHIQSNSTQSYQLNYIYSLIFLILIFTFGFWWL